MPQISVISKESHKVLDQVESNQVGLIENSVIVVKIPKEDVASITKNGADAIITLKNGEVITVQNYFSEATPDNSLVFEDEDGTLYWAKFTTANGNIADVIQYQPLDEIEPLLYNDSLTGVILPWIAGAGGAGLLGAAIGGGSDSSGGSKDTTKPDAPKNVVITDDGEHVTGKGEPGATVEVKDQDGKVIGTGTVDSSGNFDVELKDPLTNGETVDVTVTDKAGNESEPTEATAKDTTKPDAPKDVVITDDGEHVTGKGEPGTTVEVKDQDGKVIGTGTVDSSGNFDVELKDPLTNGETVDVTVTDKAGNESEPTEATAKDTTKPDAPNATLNEDGTAVTGKTEPGAKVEVHDENGKLSGSGTANSLGEFEITVSPAVTDGETAKVTAKDAAGNTSDPTTVTGGKDTLKPASPDATLNEDGTVVTGKTEPGAKVEVRDENGKLIGSGTANSLGDFEIPVSPAVTDGETAKVTAKDAAGNTSDPTTVTGGKDTLKPASPDATLNAEGTVVTGKTEQGAKVEVRDENGKLIGSGNANSLGEFEITVSPAVTDGETAKVTAKDAAGNTSDPTTVTGGKDTTKPDAPKDVVITDDGEHVTGKGEPGTTVEVKDQDGKVIGTGTVDSSGNFDVELKDPLTNGETVDVTVTDKAGNKSEPTEATAKDTTKPEAPTDVVVTDDGEHVTGKGEPGTTVEVKDQDGKVIGTGTVDSSGNFDVELKDALTNGEAVEVTVTDKAGNESEPTEATAKDTTKPHAPKDVVITDDGEHVTGKGEPGTTVEVKDQDGKVIGTGTVDSSGNFDVEIKDPLTNGETVDVTVTDKAGNESEPTEATAKDSTKPDAPNATLNADGTVVTGKTEPGAKVEVRDENGKLIGSGTANSLGEFEITVSPAVTDGETAKVTAKDAAGNTSDPTTVTGGKDTLKPASPDATLNEDGTAVTGKTEPGAKVEVRDENGKLIGSGTANSLGEFDITVSPAVTDGETAKVTAKDAAGNTSDPTTVTGGKDTTKPDAPNATLNEDGTIVTGKTEPGAKVEVRDENGKLIGSGTANGQGEFEITVLPAVTDGETAQVTAKDAAGNISDPTTVTGGKDTTKPDAPKDVDITDDGEHVTGKGEPGTAVEVKDQDGKIIGTGTVDSSGKFDVELKDPLTNGETVDVTVTDKAGNESEPTEATAKDTTKPDVPKDVVITDDGEHVTGKGEPGTIVEVKDQDGKIIGTGTVDSSGNFDVELKDPLTNGETVDVTVTDKAGNESEPTEATAIDTTKPDAPNATLNADGTVVTGKTEPGAKVEVRDENGKLIGSGNANSLGEFEINVSPAVTDGETAKVTAKDAAGNISDPTTVIGAKDTINPEISIEDTTLTQDSMPSFKGKTEAGTDVSVVIRDSKGEIVDQGEAKVIGDQWSYRADKTLIDGEYSVEAIATDAAGNTGRATDTSFTIDATAPIVTIDDFKEPNFTGTVNEDANIQVQVQDSNGKDIAGTTTVKDGTWTFTPDSPVAEADYTVTVTATDAAGNQQIETGTVNTTLPTVDIDDLFGTSNFAAALSRVSTLSVPANVPQTNQTKPTFSGTSTKSVEVTVYLRDANNKVIDSGLAKLDTATGKWTYTPANELLEGYYVLEAVSKDAAGNISSPASKTFVIDITDPVIEIQNAVLTNDVTPDVKGKTEIGSTVTVTVKKPNGDVVETGTATVDAKGDWSYSVKANLTDGAYQVAANAKDKAGNISDDVKTQVTVDSSAPKATISIDDNGDVKISFSEKVVGFDADDVQITGGKLNDLAQQTDGSWTAKVVANGNDGSAATVKLDIAAGSYSDAAGNAGQAATASHIVASIDSTAPKATITIADNGDVKISFSEKVVGFDADDVQVSGGKLTDLAQQADGSWTAKVVANGTDGSAATVKLDIAAGSYSDAAGNAGQAATASHSVASIDSTAPKAMITIADNGDVKISFSEKVIGFDADDVQITGGKLKDLAQQADGSWTAKVVANGTDGSAATVKLDIAAGSYSDAAGNAGQAATASNSVASIDSTAPKATITIADNGDVKISFSEKVVGFDADDVQVSGGKLKDLAQQADGSWTAKVVANGDDGSAATVKLDIAAGSYSDAAGNAGQAATASHSVASVDSTAPKAMITIADNGDVKISFSEKVVGFDADDVQVSGGKLNDLAQQADGSWTAKVVANGNDGSAATVKLDIAAGSYSDAAGNAGQAATASHSVASIDSTAPKATITIADNGDVKISFSEKVVGFDADDVQVSGGKLKDLAQQADGSWIGKVVANGNDGSAATVKLDIAAGSYSDAAGNAGQAATASHSVASIDSTAPKATITIADNGDVKISFSEKVVGFDADDVQVSGGKLKDLAQQADGSWIGKVVANGNDGSAATVKLDIAAGSYSDAAGNAGQAATASHSVASIDSTAPKATITIADNGDVKISFSEKVVGFDADDVQVTGGKLIDLAQQADGSWTAKVVANGNDGSAATVKLDIAAGSYSDAAGNAGQAATASHSVASIDSLAPKATITIADNGDVKISFSEKVVGFDTDDVQVTGGKLKDFAQQADGSWTAKVVANGTDGSAATVKLDIAAGSYSDAAGNAGQAATASHSVASIDSTAPTITIDDLIITNDQTPTISGETEPGASVYVYIKDFAGVVKFEGQASVFADGAWTFTPPRNLDDGEYTAVAIATDKAGNTAEANDGFEIDTTPPTVDIDDFDFFAAPAVAPLATFAMRATTLSTPSIPQTNNNKQTFSGTSSKSTEVQINIYDAENKLLDSGLAKLDTATGKWTYTPSVALPEGLLTLEAISKDIAGNISAPSTKQFIVDTIPPLIDIHDVGVITDPSPSFSGKTEKGVTVSVSVKDQLGNVVETGQALVDAQGNWSYQAKSNLTNGLYHIEAIAKDAAGNSSQKATSSTTIDSTADVSIDVQANTDGSATVTGKTEPGASVEITTPDGHTYPASVDANGQFTATIPTPAAEGTYTATATDQAGNQGSATADLDDQVAPQIADLEVDANADGSATVTGKTEPGASVEITTPDGHTYPASVDANGQFTATIPTPAAEGTYTATATDQAGNQGSATADLDDQVAPQIADLEVDANADGSATVTGKTEPGASVEITTPDGQTYPASVDANGHFTATIPTPAAEGTYTATATDQAGNQGSATADLDDQVAPQIADLEVDANADGSATVTGKTEPGASVEITTPDGQTYPATVDANGQFTATIPSPASEGTYTATATDQAGNQGSATADLDDQIAPQIVDLEVDANTDGSATVTGKTEPGASVEITTPDGQTYPATVDANGQFTATIPTPAAEGTYTATATDQAGNQGSASADLDDQIAPQIDDFKVTSNPDGSATITGKTESGAKVSITDPQGKDLDVTVDANGHFIAQVPATAAEGTYTATATDNAGNQGSATADLDDQVAPQITDLEADANTDGSATVTGKTEPGASVEITTPDGQTYPASVDANGHFTATIPSPAAEGTYTATATDNAGNQGSATADLDDQVAPQITDLEVDANTDGSATVTGKTEPGASVEITTPHGQTYPANVDANGYFTATIPTPAAEGTYTATATDQAGNQGSASADLDDQVAPQIDDFKVTSNPDGSATITGKTESGAKVSITDPQGKDIDVTVDANGHFIAQVSATAAEGTYTATATDQAGNQGYASDDLMDATVPVIPTAEVNQKDGSTVFGKAQPGSEVTVYASDAKQKLGTAVADANGAYSVQLQPALVDGEQVKVSAKDAGGESAAITAQAPDLFAPDAPTAKVNATGSAVEGVTEAFAIVTVYGGSKGTTPLGTATADANGHYSIALVPALVDGEQVKVTAKDAGGESLATPALAPDLYAPATPFATLDSQGAVVTGHAEAGSDITVYAADAKTILGTAIADLEGNFKVVLQPAVTDGQHILVTAKDDGGESAPQELIAPTVSIHAADNLVNANINFEYPVEEVRTNKLFNVFDLINIGSKVHTGYFSIGDQEVGEATISVHTGSLINLFDKAEMRLFVKNADGSWKLIASNKDYGLLDFIGIFGEETAVRAKNLQSGEYKFEFVGGSAIGLATSVSANLSLKVFDTSVEPEVSHVEEAKGNVITDHDALYGQDAVPAGSIVNSINGQLINGTTTVKGNYGTLTIHQDGSYSYKPKADVTAIGKAEVFSYSVVDPVSGKASSADLIIHIGTQSDLALNWNAAEPKDHASTVVATNNVDMIGFDASNTVSTGQSSSISYSWSIGFGGTKAGSTKITVADGTVENIKVDFGSSQLVSLLGNTTINVYDEKGKLVATSGASTVVDVIGLLPNGNSVTVTGLKAGTYTIQAVTNKGISLGGSVSAVISRSIIDLDSFTVKSAANAATKGNLLTDNDGFGVDTVASKYTDLYVSKDGGLTFTQVSSTGTTITAKYGEMVVKSDGSYTYTLKDTNLTSGAAEQFTYKLVAPNGDISAATLTIKAGVNFTGSVGNDEITSTAGNDQFTTKAGIDTVIYKVLDQADATGGNGHDTWNDFNASEGDKVNIKALLQGQNVNQSNIDQFVSVKSDGKGNTVISIDRDGTGSKFGDKVELLTLKNTDVTLQDLIDHNQLLY